MLDVGLLPNVPHEIYHQRVKGLASKSALDLVNRSPAHYKAWLDGHDEEPTPALIFGSAFHCAALEPDRFAAEYATEPDFGDCRFKAAKAERDAWRAENAGKQPLSARDAETIRGMMASIKAHPLVSRMLNEGEPELTISWRDETTGLQCKSRADYYVKNLRMVVDIKSTLDARPKAFVRDVAKYRYHVQDGMYRMGFEALGEPVEHFVFVAVEKVEPYAIAIYELDNVASGIGRTDARQDLITLAKCVEDDVWPGYSSSIQTLSLPPWA